MFPEGYNLVSGLPLSDATPSHTYHHLGLGWNTVTHGSRHQEFHVMERTTLYLCFKRASSIAPQNRFIGPDDVGPVVLISLTKAWEIGTDYHVDWRALGVSPSS